ncbi:unnamed protein product [Oppiella nova]|uniref:Uncharacterized protein n=1 Tax=Oppiella nova TaxID=334625 RepID=A0A7R9LQE4_9ACAR|nr:unnamed protein product [Oppiella nova]CAG2165944.1 unnamed protein product [Oppiella nova]
MNDSLSAIGEEVVRGLEVRLDEGLKCVKDVKDVIAGLTAENCHLKISVQEVRTENRVLMARVQELEACAAAPIDDNHPELQELRNKVLELSVEVDSLESQMQLVTEEREMARKELRDVRHENDILTAEVGRYQKYESVVHQLNKVVNSLPEFSEQIILKERPNSMTTFGSFGRMDGLRLAGGSQEEDTYHSARVGGIANGNGASCPTSNDTFYDARTSSQRSSSAQPTAQPLRHKGVQNVRDNMNETILSATDSLQSFGFDADNNLKLKLVKVVPNRQYTGVTMAYAKTPSDFWVHLNPAEVNNYIHAIQVKQEDLLNRGGALLTPADVEIGMYCAAIFSEDGYWYRAQVIDIHYEDDVEKDSIRTLKVQFVDWGNTEEVPLSKTMRLSCELKKRKQAIHCYLQGLPLDDSYKWDKESIDTFRRVTASPVKLLVTFQKKDRIDERLKSFQFPTDLLFADETGKMVNVFDRLEIPEYIDENVTQQAIPVVSTSGAQLSGSAHTSGTIVRSPKANGTSDNRLDRQKSSTEKTATDLKAKSSQNCETKASIECHAMPHTVQSLPKSMPHLNAVSTVPIIPAPIVPDSENGLIVEPSTVISPSLFYVRISDTQVGSAQFDDLDEQLNECYESSLRQHTHPSQVTVGSFWCAQYSHDERWYRSRVVDVRADRALVYYVDYGNEEWVDCKLLMPLTRKFALYPALAVRCSLSSISPIGGGSEWPEETAEHFRCLIEEKVLTACVVHKPETFDLDSILEVLLWANVDNEEILLNSKLVVSGYAVTDNLDWVKEAERAHREGTPPDVIMNGLIPIMKNNNNTMFSANDSQCSSAANNQSAPKTNGAVTRMLEAPIVLDISGDSAHTLVPTNGHSSHSPVAPAVVNGVNSVKMNGAVNGHMGNVLPERLSECDDDEDDDDWDPMEDDANCKDNRYGVQTDNPGVATMGYSAPHRMTCKYFGTGKGCKMGTFCSFLHVDPQKRYELDDMVEGFVEIVDVEIPNGSYVVVKVTEVNNPCDFYCSLPYGANDVNHLADDKFNELMKLAKDMKRHYTSAKIKEDRNIFHGMGSLVAFKDEKSGAFYRGRVVYEEIDLNIYGIFAIDLGTSLEVKSDLIYKLVPIFSQTPPLAIHCSLTGVEPFGSDTWSSEAMRTDDKYYVDLIENDSEIFLSAQLIDQKLAQKTKAFVNPRQVLSDDEIYSSADED